jgi:uncharacterized tellurite resistance protein B-like protein
MAQPLPRDEAKRALLAEIEAYFAGRHALDGGVEDRLLRMAAALLLLEMGRADFDSRPEEQEAALRALERVLGLSTADALAALRFADEELRKGRPLQHFTSLIDRHFSREEKLRVVEALWRVAFSDAELLAHEEYLVRKIADLLHVPPEDFLLAKVRAKEAFFGESSES